MSSAHTCHLSLSKIRHAFLSWDRCTCEMFRIVPRYKGHATYCESVTVQPCHCERFLRSNLTGWQARRLLRAKTALASTPESYSNTSQVLIWVYNPLVEYAYFTLSSH